MKRRIIALTCSVAMIFLFAVNVPAVHAKTAEQEQESQPVTEGIAPAATPRSITHNLYYSTYSEDNVYCNSYRVMDDPITQGYYNDYYDDGLQLRANCYGYSFRFFYRPEDIPTSLVGDYNHYYAQHPGEFAAKSQTLNVYWLNNSLCRSISNRQSLEQLYANVLMSDDYGNNEKANIFEQLMEADAAALGYTITSCDAATVPGSTPSTSKRMIAFVAGGNDFHFYMQHSDGTWSHKPGNNPTSNECLCTQSVVLTNSNIAAHAAEGMFAGGVVKFYYITKNTVIDFGHKNGKYETCAQTSLYASDGAGNEPETAKNKGTVSQISQFGYIDYVGDIDYYYFIPSATKSYTFSSSTSSSLPLQVVLCNRYGSLLISRTSNSGTVNFTYSLTAGYEYIIFIQTYNQEEHEYMRTYTVTVQ